MAGISIAGRLEPFEDCFKASMGQVSSGLYPREQVALLLTCACPVPAGRAACSRGPCCGGWDAGSFQPCANGGRCSQWLSSPWPFGVSLCTRVFPPWPRTRAASLTGCEWHRRGIWRVAGTRSRQMNLRSPRNMGGRAELKGEGPCSFAQVEVLVS